MAYNIKDIIELARVQEVEVYSGRNTLFEERLRLFHGKINCAQPKGWPRHVPPTHKRLVRWAVNQLISDIPVVSVMGGKSEKSRNNADVCRLYLQSQLNQWDRKSDIPPLKECAENMMIYGEAVLKLLYDVSSWGRKLDKDNFRSQEDFDSAKDKRDFYKITRPAILLFAPDPMHVFPDLAGEFTMEIGERTVGAIKAQWKDWTTDKKSYERVKWIEFWSPEQRAYLADEKPLLNNVKIDGETYSEVIPNALGFDPYSHKYSGWGKTSPYGDIEEKCVSVYDGLESSIETEARSKTAVTNQLRKEVYGRYLVSPEWSDEAIKQMGTEPGAMVKAPENVEIDKAVIPFPQSNISPDVYRLISMMDADMEQMLSSNARGTYAGESALHAQVGEVRERMNFAPPLRALEEMLGDVLTKTLHLVKNVIYEDVPIAGTEKAIKPENIEEPCVVEVKLMTRNPQEDRERIATGLELVQAGLCSEERFHREFEKITDVEDEMAQIAAERLIKSSPMLQQALAVKAVEKLGMKEALQVIQQEGVQEPKEIQDGRSPAPPTALTTIESRSKNPPRSVTEGYQPRGMAVQR